MMILRRSFELNREPHEMLLSVFLVFRESHSDSISFTRHRYRFTILELTIVFFEDLASLSFFYRCHCIACDAGSETVDRLSRVLFFTN